MEIRDYLRAVRRRIWLPLLIPVLAGGLTGLLVLMQPAQYTAQTTVVVPSLSAKGYSTSAVTQYVSTYKDVIGSRAVIDAVAGRTHAKPADVDKATAGTATASSNIIIVNCQSGEKAVVAPMCNELALVALDTLVAPQLAKAKDETVTGQKAVDKANSDIAAFQQASGSIDPTKDYGLQSTELQQLITQKQQAEIAGDTARSITLGGIIADRQKAVARLGTQVIKFSDLRDNKTVALGALQHAQQDLQSVTSTIASNHAAGSVVTADNGHVSRVPAMLRFGGIAAAFALMLCLGLIILLELMKPRRIVPVPAVRAWAGAMPATIDLGDGVTPVAGGNGAHASVAEPTAPRKR